MRRVRFMGAESGGGPRLFDQFYNHVPDLHAREQLSYLPYNYKRFTINQKSLWVSVR
jgi:hypothetical protein